MPAHCAFVLHSRNPFSDDPDEMYGELALGMRWSSSSLSFGACRQELTPQMFTSSCGHRLAPRSPVEGARETEKETKKGIREMMTMKKKMKKEEVSGVLAARRGHSEIFRLHLPKKSSFFVSSPRGFRVLLLSFSLLLCPRSSSLSYPQLLHAMLSFLLIRL